MFTGIIEEQGTVVALRREGQAARLSLKAKVVLDDLHVGDSLAVNGVCLTVERPEPDAIVCSMMPETLRRTTLGELQPRDRVNLERALRLDTRLGGHLVAGHVDGIGTVSAVSGVGEERVITIQLPGELMRFVAPQGSIAVDGVSLTVVDVSSDSIAVSLIRHTLAVTTLSTCVSGTRVNIEVDLIARYVARLQEAEKEELSTGLTLDGMRDMGY